MLQTITRSAFFLLTMGVLSACAMQRAADAETAQKQMIGISKEQVFACMGIPKRKATEGNTEIWAYKSTSGWTGKSSASTATSWTDRIGAAFTLEDQVKEKRFCTVQIVMTDGRVKAVRYNGPTGGFMTEDEQCAYAIRNCI